MLGALHMGVPAVSLEGSAIQLRVGSSHLHAVGLDDLSATTVTEYIEKVVGLAMDTQCRRHLRQYLRPALSRTAFTDVDMFAAGFDEAMKRLIDHPSVTGRAIRRYSQGATMSDAQKITIDGKDYALNEISDQAKEQLTNVRAVDQEIQRLQMKLAIAQTARAAYANALKNALGEDGADEAKMEI